MGADLATVVVNLITPAIVVIFLLAGVLVTGREHSKLEKENELLRAALALERQRNADLMTWAMVGAKAMTSVAEAAQAPAAIERPGGPGVPGG